MIIRWLDDAVVDLQSLRHYIAQDDRIAANRVVKKVLHAINILTEQPGIGRQGRVINTRELVVSGTPYIVAYHVKHNVIRILRILHSAMEWPDDL